VAPSQTLDASHVHRRLSDGSSGVDARELQLAVNRKAMAWKLEQFEVDAEGEVGEQTLNAARHLLYAMGVAGRPMIRIRGFDYKPPALTRYAQRLLRGSRPRTAAMKTLAVMRKPRIQRWRRQGLPDRAVQIAESLVGVMEEGGNNTGKRVAEIITSNGGYVGEPWCGDFVAYCYRNAGSKAVTRSWASVSLLGGVAGLRRSDPPRRGDLVRYTFDHVGIFLRDLGNGEIETIEGNTGASGAVSDSTTGGDGVYRKRRDKSLVNDYLRVTR
jgi:hypothetical protein